MLVNENQSGSDLSIDMSAAQDEISRDLFGPGESTPEDSPSDPAPTTAAAEEKSAPAPAATPAPATPAPTDSADSTPPAATRPIDTPPPTWRKESHAHWNALPEAVREEIHKREQDMFRGLETYKTAASLGQGLHKVLQPYIPVMQQHNVDPMQQIGNLMQAHYTLAMGTPEQKLQFFAKIAGDYGIDISNGDFRLAAHPSSDPQVAALLEKISSLESRVSGLHEGKVKEVQASIASEIEAFAKDPKHVYFDEVMDSMERLIRNGQANNLSEAYEQAVWLNPVTRGKEVARQATEKAAADAKAAADHAAKAKRANAANLRSSSSSASAPGGTAKLDSLDDTLKAKLAEIKSRD